MDRVSQALRGHLPSVFATDPLPVLALRLRHDAGATWAVVGSTLTLQAGQEPVDFDLTTYTLGSLADAVAAAGFEVAYQHTAVRHLAATTLLEGAGDQALDNGDHLAIFTAPLAVMLDALGLALGEGKAAIGAALAQLVLPQATGEWADLFGDLFGVPRRGTVKDSGWHTVAALLKRFHPHGASGHALTLHAAWQQFFANLLALPRQPGESNLHHQERLILAAQQRAAADSGPEEADAAYTARIRAEVARERGNPAAMRRNLQEQLAVTVRPREPWQELFALSGSVLSGTDHLQGAPIYEYHRLQLVAERGLDWPRVLREAEADRPAGTLLLPPETQPPPLHVNGIPLTSHLGRALVWAEELQWHAYGRVGVDLRLSAALPPPPAALGVVNVIGIGDDGLRGPYEYFGPSSLAWYGQWDTRTWAAGNVSQAEFYPPNTLES